MSVTIAVLVPAFKRPDDLRRCLAAIERQTRPPDEVVVSVRDIDPASRAVAQEAAAVLPLRIATLTVPGQVAALDAGLALVASEFVAITDDDAAPWPDWLARILAHFAADPRIAGVGGRDYVYVRGALVDGAEPVVGRVPRIGKHIGNHHVGTGPARDVDSLKGVNGAYRVSALRRVGFDTRLRGSGAQVHNEMSVCQRLRRTGWRLVYDPAVAVDHYPAVRFDEDQREGFSPVAMSNAVYNETLIRLECLSPLERAAQIGWSVAIGTRAAPGLAQWLRFFPRERGLATDKLRAALRGRWDAIRDLRTLAPAARARRM